MQAPGNNHKSCGCKVKPVDDDEDDDDEEELKSSKKRPCECGKKDNNDNMGSGSC